MQRFFVGTSGWSEDHALGVDAYVFFDNHCEAHTPANARRLRELLD
jgi:uncharacterized protein YecE (DUF72 family)